MADDTTDLPGDELDGAPSGGPDLDAAYPPPRDRSREAALLAAALSVIAGVLCVVAPFRAVYTLHGGGFRASFDGWGRYDLSAGQHGPRYGVALTVAALVLVIAAATRLRDLRPVGDVSDDDGMDDDGTVHDPDAVDTPPAPSSDDRLAAGVGVAGSALLLGVLASVALSVESTVSNADAIAATPGGTATTVDVGAMLWLLVGAWVISVAAVYLPWFEGRRRG